ncbi:hypothetical protein DYB32_006237 [Aphanomyces invadans]|uniref:Uncharacterized protein n=1 Tax=Aphanomyces invadans TaxID=157072 RepID=A0A3R6ZNE4_9STRA|nr:hypothetical protein DYB32_006237 [Aphanomyces invadans]
MLAEFAQLGTLTSSMKTSFESTCSQDPAASGCILKELVRSGDADHIQAAMKAHPVVFGTKLRMLAKPEPASLVALTHLRLLNRWMRATWGSSVPFATLYRNVSNHQFALHTLPTDLKSILASSSLEGFKSGDPSDCTVLLCHEADSLLAQTELLLGSIVPCYYSHDTTINAATSEPVLALPVHEGGRYLSSSNLYSILLDSALGVTLQRALVALLQPLDTARTKRAHTDTAMDTSDTAKETLSDWSRNMDTEVRLRSACSFSVLPSTQVMFHSSSPWLVQGNLEEQWSNATTG